MQRVQSAFIILAFLPLFSTVAKAENFHQPPHADYIVYDGSQKECGKPLKMTHLESDYRHQIYLNFDGGDLKAGGNDSSQNLTDLITVGSLKYPALNWSRLGGRDKAIKIIMDELKMLYGEIAVEFVITRPTSGEYTMAMVGGTGENCKKGGPGTAGIAPLDCPNSRKNDVALIFGDKMGNAKEVAMVIAHELGHTFGLDHVTDVRDVMYPQLNQETCCWTTSALDGGSCNRDPQDSKKVLIDNIGAGEGDILPPVAWFIYPQQGATVPSNFSFAVNVADNLRVHHVELFVDGEKKASLENGPFTLALKGLKAGDHTLAVKVYDYKPNVTEEKIKLTVSDDCVKEGGCFYGLRGIGGTCEGPEDCTSGICMKEGDMSICTEGCDQSTSICPTGMLCSKLNEKMVCSKTSKFTLEIKDMAGGETGCKLTNFEDPFTASSGWVLFGTLLTLLAISLIQRRK